MLKKRLTPLLVVISVVAVGAWAWGVRQPTGPGEGFISGNGRIEATEVDVATKTGGRIEEILVREGASVKAGDVLARMQIDSLDAQAREAQAMYQQSLTNVAQAQAQVAARRSEHVASRAAVVQRETDLEAAKRRLERSEVLTNAGATAVQTLDDDRAAMRNAEAAVEAAKAQEASAAAAVRAAEASRVGAEAAVKAAQATVDRAGVDLADTELKAPRDGRVQFRLAEPGEVLGPGGKVLNIVDLSDVYMTFFVPEPVAGRLSMGTEARIVLDIAPQITIPARVSFVADTAQFTPKTVETASERQKLMFRVRARIDEALLKSRLDQVKTGLPGVAWIRLDEQQPWPPELSQVAQP